MERLIGAILLKAVEDWDDPKNRPEIEEFLKSDWFSTLTEVLDLDQASIRQQLKKGKYKHLNTRAAYR